jgi:3-oxoacyl-[acyl-carrier-protein] synthase-1
MSSNFNDNPERASRTFDVNRDGFVISGGGSILVLEEYEHAVSRGAKIYAEVVGYGATSDGHDMVAPSGEGAQRCMEIALKENKTTDVSYLNTHGTSTPVGDSVELEAIRKVFEGGGYGSIPMIASTKSLSGHALGAAGSNEAIYSLIMMNGGFLTPSANIDELDSAAKNLPILLEKNEATIEKVMSNSFGFGGVNASLIFSMEQI